MTTGEVLPRGGDQRSASARQSIANLAIEKTQKDRAAQAGISVAQQKKLDAIARRSATLLADVRSGRKSTDAAYKEAMGKAAATPFEEIARLIEKYGAVLTTTEKRKLREMLG